MTAMQKVSRVSGGFIKGICHGEEHAAEAKAMGIDWVRFDMPYPVNPDGSFTERFMEYRKKCIEMSQIGVRTIGITNYGREYAEHGIDIRSRDGLKQIEEETGVSDYIGFDLYHCSWTDGPYTGYGQCPH